MLPSSQKVDRNGYKCKKLFTSSVSSPGLSDVFIHSSGLGSLLYHTVRIPTFVGDNGNGTLYVQTKLYVVDTKTFVFNSSLSFDDYFSSFP